MKGGVLKLVGLVLAFFLFVFCRVGSAQEVKGILAVSAGIVPCVEEIMTAFVAQGGQPLSIVSGATGKLARQIDSGAPYDIFLSADPKWRKWLEERGHRMKVEVCAFAKLSIWWPGDSEDKGVSFLSNAVLAVPNPAYAAYGRMAKVYFEGQGYWEEGLKEGRFIFCDNVPQCVVVVRSKGADAALIPVSAAIKAKGSYIILEGAGRLATEAILLGDRVFPNVLEFSRFLRSEKAKGIWKKWGFDVPDEIMSEKREGL
ncbi:molybdate ABC transporter substrate-binding protein [Thermovirga lienii]|jgi:molybdate transport system substrate-binding protein|uniref:molybdate ABC transporter substrate-binding protein n=1 Tax=Thermovirga lienii TaxID=336261 RepID=UPI002FE25FAA